MLYPAYLYVGDDGHAHGVVLPDFPACRAAADMLEDLPAAIREAVGAHGSADDVRRPEPTPIAKLEADPGYFGGLGCWSTSMFKRKCRA